MLGEPGSRLRAEWEKAYLVPRPGTGDDVAATALFLASADAAYITGETIVVDGGLCISGMQGVPLQRGIYDDAMIAAASRGSGISYDREQ
jgi:enoyl-[acyl-carrier-protein] reductase (NADH)